ncbi:hypothetical protein HALLA_01650 (plasmid) [Halostagnicola larsenii XH-48]|uniref:Cytochrome oxidase subunit I profile domain-containing protein n=1 Tax=Halostagnicola larsenii XH-48 TaxID=797299 RepID=W0JXK3_9EURY|nr:hypothetical protein HALLA_01650 [Halostagnicola larsenii XH-48]
MDTAGKDFPYRMAFYFIVASSVWNFFGAGVIGFFINLPVISYFESGTYLTVAHAHGAMFGAFGFLAMGMAVYILRITTRPEQWSERRLTWSFWLCNVGIALMLFLSLLPVGFLQLEVAFTEGYAASRSLEFYSGNLIQTLFWLRMPGDTLLILGAIVFAGDILTKLLFQRKATAEETSRHIIADRIVGEGVGEPDSDDD